MDMVAIQSYKLAPYREKDEQKELVNKQELAKVETLRTK